MIEHTPRVSFGVPVRNGEDCLPKCLDSLLAQDFSDFEIIVSDNASTDSTPELLEQYAAKDDRIRLALGDENVGIIENFNKLTRLARGEYFRWVGSDDWLEPSYASKCVAALDADRAAIVATSYFTLHFDSGEVAAERYAGELPDSEQAARRLARMLWFFGAGPAVYDPNYSMIRREVLQQIGGLQIHPSNDWVLAAELSLRGRMIQVPEMLFHREFPLGGDRYDEGFRRRLHPTLWNELLPSLRKLIASLFAAVDRAGVGGIEALRCYVSILGFAAHEARRRTANRLRHFRRDRLGLTRESLGIGREGPA